jgi:alkylation response protein AidB-like acyl-CoA dehydrogenase
VLVEAMAEVGRRADAKSREMEQLGHLPLDIADALVDSRLFQAWVPGAYGGDQRHVVDVLDAVEEASYWEGSLGWCAMIGATTALLAAHLEPEWSRKIYADPRACTGGFAMPAGRATATDGGLSVTGRWQWGSGTHNCTWIGGGCRLVDDEGRPAPRSDGLAAPFVFFDRQDVELLDTWDVMGLRATGSTDYRVGDAFVPEGRWAQPGSMPPFVDAPLYRFPFLAALALGVSAVARGRARRAHAELVGLAGHKRPAQSSRTLAERAVVQVEVAQAEASFRSARAFVRERVEEAWAAAVEGPLPDGHRRDLRLAATHATLRAKEAVDLAYHAAGGSSVYRTSPLERVFRDVHVATQHGMVAPRTLEPLGRMALGLPTDTTSF